MEGARCAARDTFGPLEESTTARAREDLGGGDKVIEKGSVEVLLLSIEGLGVWVWRGRERKVSWVKRVRKK